MNKLSKVFLIIIVILVIALGIMTYAFFYWRASYSRVGQQLYDTLELVGGSVTIDDNGNVITGNEEQNATKRQEEISEKLMKVNIEVVEDSVTPTTAILKITDKNDVKFDWSNGYKIYVSKNNEYMEIEPILINLSQVNFLDENNEMMEQIEIEIDWSKYYGILPKGKYHIEIPACHRGYGIIATVGSNEFEIK